MTNLDLARSYLFKARKRLKVLGILMEEGDYSDVVREAQEIVELALKAMLRWAGIDPPKWHDVGPALLAYRELFPQEVQGELEGLARISAWLRKERELSFYGDVDFIPTEEYDEGTAREAFEGARKAVEVAQKLIEP